MGSRTDIGAAITRRFNDEGMAVALQSRTSEKTSEVRRAFLPVDMNDKPDKPSR